MNQHVPPPLRGRSWSEDETRLVMAAWNDGKSALQIAKDIGRSKNAVIGAITRLRNEGFSMRSAAPKGRESTPSRDEAARFNASRERRVMARAKALAAPNVQYREPTVYGDPAVVGRPLDALSATGCRYECAGGTDAQSYLFCGGRKRDRSSYCAAHHTICWSPAT